MKNLSLAILLGVIGMLPVSAVAQTSGPQMFIATLKPKMSPVSGRVGSVAVDPADPVALYRVTEGEYKLMSSGKDSEGLALQAGATLRLRLAKTNAPKHLLLKSSVPISYEAPCDGRPAPPESNAATPDVVMIGEVIDEGFDWKTADSWKGTCRVMVFELVDRWEYAIKVKFN